MQQLLKVSEKLAQVGRGIECTDRVNRKSLGSLAARALCAFWNEENGQDMVEYSLLLGFITLSGLGVLSGVRNQTVTIWQAISAGFVNAAA
jgi:Flp pilus assembly pilin Flp